MNRLVSGPGLVFIALALVSLLIGAACLLAYQKSSHRLGLWERPQSARRSAQGGPGPRVVFLGASVLQMWDLAWHLPEYETINAGVGWSYAGTELLRFRSDVLVHEPDVVVIEVCAINYASSAFGALPPPDPERVKDAVLMMVQLARANGIAPILCTPLPVSEEWGHTHSPGDIRVRLLELGRWMRDIGAVYRVEVADLHTATADINDWLPTTLTRDGLHPNAEGYARMTECIRPAIQRALASLSPEELDKKMQVEQP